MPDMTAMELEADLSTTLPTRLDHALLFFSRALFTVALVAGGAALVTIALTVGVVGAPVIVAAIVVTAVSRLRARGAGSLRPAR
jgi:hypothetical protein